MADEEKKPTEAAAPEDEATLEAAKESGVSKESLEEEDKFQYKKEDVTNEKLAEKADEKYTGDNIQVLEGLEAVRKRPGMYIATTAAPGLHHLVWEIVDNSIDEALAGYCDAIEVTINKDNSITVQDNGRGVPVDVVKKTGLSGVETAFTILHAGGKFGDGGGYKVSGGLHGVGASVVNALSTWMEVTVHKDGGIYYIKFTNGGKINEHLKKIGDCTDHGTTVSFMPDPEIFTETTVYNYETIKNHLRQMAFLNGGVKITLTDLRGEQPVTETFLYNGGIREYVSASSIPASFRSITKSFIARAPKRLRFSMAPKNAFMAKSPCNGPTTIPRMAFIPSATTSAPRKAAPTSRALTSPSTGRSTITPINSNSSKTKSRTSRPTIAAKV
jgi:hypothetical protein